MPRKSRKVTKKLDTPYDVKGCGRLIVGKQRDTAEIAGQILPRSIVGGVLLADLVGDDCGDYELWDVEFTLTVRRKHRGSPRKGASMDIQLLSALNEPEQWKKKIFDTLQPQ